MSGSIFPSYAANAYLYGAPMQAQPVIASQPSILGGIIASPLARSVPNANALGGNPALQTLQYYAGNNGGQASDVQSGPPGAPSTGNIATDVTEGLSAFGGITGYGATPMGGIAGLASTFGNPVGLASTVAGTMATGVANALGVQTQNQVQGVLSAIADIARGALGLNEAQEQVGVGEEKGEEQDPNQGMGPPGSTPEGREAAGPPSTEGMSAPGSTAAAATAAAQGVEAANAAEATAAAESAAPSSTSESESAGAGEGPGDAGGGDADAGSPGGESPGSPGGESPGDEGEDGGTGEGGVGVRTGGLITYQGVKRYARGGIIALEGGGKVAIGPGGGLDDLIPTNIDGRRAAALSDGEFVIPADVVSMMGDGSSNAGARRLYDLVKQIREEKTGTSRQAGPLPVAQILKRTMS